MPLAYFFQFMQSVKRLVYTSALFLLLGLHICAQQVIDVDEVTAEDTSSTSDLQQSSASSTTSVTHAQTIANRVRALLRNPLFNHSQVGLCVYDLTDDSLIYAYHPHYRLRPASNAKVITAVTALDLLGPDYKYRTTMLSDYAPDTLYTRLNDSVFQERIYLAGNLYVHGGFDPLLGSQEIDQFIAALKQRGISEIRGNIVLDTSLKDENRLGWGWCWDDNDPPLVSLLYNGKDDFASAFFSRLYAAGIKLGGKMIGGYAPDSAYVVCQIERNMADIMRPMMKNSDNLFAESMFYQLAAHGGTRGATRKEAAAVIDSLVARLGLDYSIYEFADGSGLSLYNYASPWLLLTLLRHAYANPAIYNALLPTLPIAGVDGTLSNRMQNTSAAGNVYAKTGTVTGVSTLSGYCTASNGHRLAFAIMNNGLRNAASGREFQDRVCVALCK